MVMAISEVELVCFLGKVEGVHRHEKDTHDPHHAEGGCHRGWLRSQDEGPKDQERAKQRANGDEYDVETTE